MGRGGKVPRYQKFFKGFIYKERIIASIYFSKFLPQPGIETFDSENN